MEHACVSEHYARRRPSESAEEIPWPPSMVEAFHLGPKEILPFAREESGCVPVSRLTIGL